MRTAGPRIRSAAGCDIHRYGDGVATDDHQPLYQPLGAAHNEDGRWVWTDPFAMVVPAGQ